MGFKLLEERNKIDKNENDTNTILPCFTGNNTIKKLLKLLQLNLNNIYTKCPTLAFIFKHLLSGVITANTFSEFQTIL